jgi:PhzF family phenazine biosynthesis protein
VRRAPDEVAMQIVPFKQVDVFTRRAFGGNPVAVILDAEGMDGLQMQRIANWTNLSETAFVLPPSSTGASYRVRIFTPVSELPFAGHPSVGTAHAVLESGLVKARDGAMVQECAAGLLPVTVHGEGAGQLVALRAPASRHVPFPTGADGLLEAALAGVPRGTIAPQLFDNGPRWWLVELADADEVRAHQPNLPAIAALTTATGAVGLAVHAPAQADDHQHVVRAYCPADGIPEDPVTGSAIASIGAQLLAAGHYRNGDAFIASQGRELGRDGLVQVRLRDDGVWIGGHSVTVVDGMIRFDEI